MRLSILSGLLTSLCLVGCVDPFTVFHSKTGEPILIGRRAYTYEGCLATLRDEAEQLGVTFRYVHIRGSTFGRSLLWPFYPGYACEASVGPEHHPSGIYPNVPPLTPRG